MQDPPKNNPTRLNMLLQNSGLSPAVSKALSETFEARALGEREFWVRSLDTIKAELAAFRVWLAWLIALAATACLLLLIIAVLIYFHH